MDSLFSSNHHSQIQDSFDFINIKDSNDYLSINDISLMTRLENYNPSKGDLDIVTTSIEEIDKGNFLVSSEEKEEFYIEKSKKMKKIEKLIGIFSLFDKENTGLVSSSEFFSLIQMVNGKITEKELRKLYLLCDVDCDGSINYIDLLTKVNYI